MEDYWSLCDTLASRVALYVYKATREARVSQSGKLYNVVTSTVENPCNVRTSRLMPSTTAVKNVQNYGANFFMKWIQARRPTVQVPDTVYAALVFVYR